jgi:hypothetical protein
MVDESNTGSEEDGVEYEDGEIYEDEQEGDGDVEYIEETPGDGGQLVVPQGYGGDMQMGGMGMPPAGFAEYPQDVGTTMSDNDYINLLRDITDPNLRKQIDHYLKHNPLTPAALHKLKIYYRGTLNMGLVASNLRNEKDFKRIEDRYLIIKCEMPLGLTCYDVNDTYGHIVNLIDLNFLNQELRAVGGFHMKRIATTTSENVQHDQSSFGQYDQRAQEQTTMQKLTSFLR